MERWRRRGGGEHATQVACDRVREGANTEPPSWVRREIYLSIGLGDFRHSENISIIGLGLQSRASRSNLAKQHLAAVVGVL